MRLARYLRECVQNTAFAHTIVDVAHLGNQAFLVAHLINATRGSESVDNCGSSCCIMKNPNYSIAQLQMISGFFRSNNGN